MSWNRAPDSGLWPNLSNSPLTITNQTRFEVLPDLLLQFSISWPHRNGYQVIRRPLILLGIQTPLEATAISKVEGVQSRADGGSVRHQKGETPEVTAPHLEIKTNNILNEIERRALVSSKATARLIETQAHLAIKTSDATPLKIREFARSLSQTDVGSRARGTAGENFGSFFE